MASVLQSPELVDCEDQTAFNLAVWQEVLADRFLASIPHRVETDRYGQIVMSPPTSPEHGEEQVEIASILKSLLRPGHVISECPVSTTEGVKAVDVAWMSKPRRQAQRGKTCFTQAPEICVEIISPGNSRRELHEKKILLFEAGAAEVWLCHRDGQMEFFRKEAVETPAASILCPQFPKSIHVE